MQVKKNCLILAAGFGTRMGQIGQSLPKVLWPLFEKSLLEVQLEFAKNLGYQNLWINLHHQADLILEKTKDIKIFEDVRWLREHPEILDIGGAIHHLASQPEIMYKGELLILNADQILWFTKEDLDKWKDRAFDWDVLLLNRLVNSSGNYNQVVSDENRKFVEVVKNAEIQRDNLIETYSGNALVLLDNLKPIVGKSAFFESVCNPHIHNCKTALLSEGKYWDFGTVDRYWNSINEIVKMKCQNESDSFTKFLEKINAFNPRKLCAEKSSYGCNESKVVNLGSGKIASGVTNCIVLSGNKFDVSIEKARIIYNELTQTL